MKKTPFYETHLLNNGKMINFADYLMPLFFLSPLKEVNQTRLSVGLFDVSHMGRFEIRGKNFKEFANYLTTNNVSALRDFEAQYSCLLYEDGGIVDDLVLYNLGSSILLVVNSANIEKDWTWINSKNSFGSEILNRTEEIAQLAVQGPKSELVLQKLTETNLSELGFYWAKYIELAGVKMLISRTGYTGEDGFELYFEQKFAKKIWDEIFKAGEEYGIIPCGLAARDILRLEMGYCLYGQDITKETNPLEAQIGFVVAFGKEQDFIGKKALEKIKKEGIKRKLVGIEMLKETIPRPHCVILKNGAKIGEVTSGAFSPSLKKGIGLGYVSIEEATLANSIEVSIKERNYQAQIVRPPFYKYGTRKKH